MGSFTIRVQQQFFFSPNEVLEERVLSSQMEEPHRRKKWCCTSVLARVIRGSFIFCGGGGGSGSLAGVAPLFPLRSEAFRGVLVLAQQQLNGQLGWRRGEVCCFGPFFSVARLGVTRTSDPPVGLAALTGFRAMFNTILDILVLNRSVYFHGDPLLAG